MNIVDNDIVEDIATLGLVEEGASSDSAFAAAFFFLALLLCGEFSILFYNLLGYSLFVFGFFESLVENFLQVFSLLGLKLVHAADTESSEFSLGVEELLSSSERWVQVECHQLVDRAANIAVEHIIKLLEALLRVLSNRRDAATLGQNLIRLSNLCDYQLIDRHSALESLVSNLRPNTHQVVLEDCLLVDFFAPFVFDVVFLFFGELQVCSLPHSSLSCGFPEELLTALNLEHGGTFNVVFSRVFPAVHGVDRVDKEFHEKIHTLLILDDEIDLTLAKFERDALPCVERQLGLSTSELLSLGILHQDIVIKATEMLTIDPETRGESTIDDSLNV